MRREKKKTQLLSTDSLGFRGGVLLWEVCEGVATRLSRVWWSLGEMHCLAAEPGTLGPCTLRPPILVGLGKGIACLLNCSALQGLRGHDTQRGRLQSPSSLSFSTCALTSLLSPSCVLRMALGEDFISFEILCIGGPRGRQNQTHESRLRTRTFLYLEYRGSKRSSQRSYGGTTCLCRAEGLWGTLWLLQRSPHFDPSPVMGQECGAGNIPDVSHEQSHGCWMVPC